MALHGLRALRLERMLSQRMLAREAGVAYATVAKLEKGTREAYPMTIHKLARALGVNPRVLTETPKEQP